MVGAFGNKICHFAGKKKREKKVSWRRSKKVPSSVFRSVFRIIFRSVFRIVLVKPTNAYVCRLGLVSLPPALSLSLSVARGALCRACQASRPACLCARARFSGGSFPFVLLLVRLSHSCVSLPLSVSAFFPPPPCFFFSWSGAIVLVLVQRRRSKEKKIKQF